MSLTLSRREMRLLLATLAVVLLGLGFVIGKNQLRRLSEVETELAAARLRSFRNERALGGRPDLLQALARIRAQLPRHAVGREVTSELSRQVQALAAEAGVRLTGRTPEAEESLEDIGVHQMSIRCSWTGTPENLVGFLYRLQLLGAVADLRELRFRASPRTAEGLSGTFTLDFAYSRVAAPTDSQPSDTGAAP